MNLTSIPHNFAAVYCRSFVLSLVFVAGGTFAGCDRTTAEPSTDDARLIVTCTTGQVAELVTALAGDLVQVRTLIGPGIDPHFKRATPSDLRSLREASAVFYNGLHLEGRMVDTLASLGKSKPVHAVTEDLERDQPDRLRRAAEFAGVFDPHVWHDVALWSQCASTTAKHLKQLLPQHSGTIGANLETLKASLARLDYECRASIESVPKERRVLVTAHDAFGYFGRAYDIEVHGLQGISTVDEADLAGMSSLIELLVSRHVKAVFVESSVSPKNIGSLMEACEQQGHVVKLGGELFSDALGSAGTPEATYAGMIRHNVQTIVTALR